MVSAAVGQSKRKPNMVAQGDWNIQPLGLTPESFQTKKKGLSTLPEVMNAYSLVKLLLFQITVADVDIEVSQARA